jgi:hypothetical protein
MKPKYCPVCENELECTDPGRLIFDCPTCESILFESETDAHPGETKGKPIPTAEELNHRKDILHKKSNLSKYPADFAPEWLALSRLYSLIDSKANAAGCLLRYRRLTGDNTPSPRPPRIIHHEDSPSLSRPEAGKRQKDWQKQKGMD